MALPSTVTTNLWPEHKNAVTGPFSRIAQEAQDTHTTTAAVGRDDNNTAIAQSFVAPASGPLVSADIYVSNIGNPTDGVQLKLYDHDSINDAPGNLLATGQLLPASTATTTPSYKRIVFPSPYQVVSGTTYWLHLARTGTKNVSNYYIWSFSDVNPYAGGKLRLMNVSGTWSDVPSGDARFKANVLQPGRYVFARDNSANKIRCYKSTDNETWTEQDSANAPAITSTANLKSFHALQFGNLVLVFVITSSTRLDIFHYNTQTDAWGSSVFNTTAPTFNANVSGMAPMLGLFRPVSTFATVLSDYLFVNNGATESVMGTARRRVKLSRRLISDGTWNTPYDVVGSNFTPDATLPGTAVDYDVRTAIVLGTAHVLVFWTQSDDSSIRQRMFSNLNAFGSAVVIGSPAAVISNTSAYPMGQAVGFFKSPNWWIAFPYVDSGVLKVARARVDLVNGSGNWTLTSVVTATIETTNSNPAVLVPDNENGGRLFLFFTKTDGKLYVTNDGGTDTWVEAQEFRPGTKTVAGLSAQVLSDAIGLAYFDTSPTPDAVRYDQAEVFF